METKMDVDKPAIVIELPIYERIHRIRRSLNVIQGIAPSAKARHTRARKLINISNGMVLEAGEKNREYAERMLVIPLCLAERAWSYAMQLKQEVSECPRRRFHLVRRLAKAAEYATRFEKLVYDPESPCSERTKKEATAYAAYVNGLYKMERENWVGAKEDFHKSLVLYTTLSLSVRSETFLEQYRLRIDELRASLRFCIFSLGEKPAVSKVKLPSTLQFHDIAFRHLREQEAKQASVSQKEVAKDAAVKDAVPTSQVAINEDEDEDEFVETREAVDEDRKEEEEEEEEEEESETESDDDDQQQSREGGVTGLVKGWLGGAWSK